MEVYKIRPSTTDSITSSSPNTLSVLTMDNPSLQSPKILSSSLSPKQTQEIIIKITETFKKHGRVTLELINLFQTQHFTNQKSTSTTPLRHLTFLSSNKMADTAPSCFRLTVQQLSRYLGFRTLKNWDIIYDVGQPTYYYLLHSLETPLALGCVAYIRSLQ